MMGQGKTSAMINYINTSGEDVRFLFITPYLTEVERIIEFCPDKQFKQPETYGSKLNDIKRLFRQKENIVSTHSLFNLLDDEAVSLITKGNYVLIMDEVANLVSKFTASDYDAELLSEKCIVVGEDNTLKWKLDDYTGKFDDYRYAIEAGNVKQINKNTFIYLFPIEVFRAFTKVFVMTYMFDAQIQRYYFDLNGLKYQYKYITGDSLKNYRLCDTPTEYKNPKLKELIHICENRKLNKIGDGKFALSKNWYQSDFKKEKVNRVRNNCYSFFRRTSKTPANKNLWTTFSQHQKSVSTKGFASGFLSCNARATNKFKHKTAVAYLLNRFIDPNVANFFSKQGVVMDAERYALSEMIQFIWRSAIRDGKEIWVYIPSERMRNLFKQWIDEVSEVSE